MADTLKLEIITPEGTVYSDDVEMVTLPGIVGEMGVLPQHVPLMTQMVPGEIIVHKNGRDTFIATGEGLIAVEARRVSVLTDLAIAADRIDEAKAEEARRRAEARLREKLSDEEVAFRHRIVFAFEDLFETANGFRYGNLFALAPGEGLRHAKGLAEEALDLTRAENRDFVIRGELIHA